MVRGMVSWLWISVQLVLFRRANPLLSSPLQLLWLVRPQLGRQRSGVYCRNHNLLRFGPDGQWAIYLKFLLFIILTLIFLRMVRSTMLWWALQKAPRKQGCCWHQGYLLWVQVFAVTVRVIIRISYFYLKVVFLAVRNLTDYRLIHFLLLLVWQF